MESIGTFDSISKKLWDKDTYVQGEVGHEIFDAWYKFATQYAKGELSEGFILKRF